jgi:hypothetical protein
LIDVEFKRALLSQQKKLRKIWFAFADGILLFLALPHILPPELKLGYRSEIFRAVLWLAAVADVASLAWWNKKYSGIENILREALGNHRLKPLAGLPQPQSPLETGAVKVVSWYWLVKTAGFAFAESIAVFGFVLGVVGGYFLDQYILSGIGGVLLIYQFPLADSFETILREYEGRAVDS